MDNRNDNFLIKDWFKCTFIFFTRLVCCFLLEYWLALQSIALLLTIVICGCNFFAKFFVKEEVTQENKFQKLVVNEPVFKKYVEKNMPEIIIPTSEPESGWGILSKLTYFVAEFVLLIYIAIFIGCSIISGKS
jgi:hypothetical protein